MTDPVTPPPAAAAPPTSGRWMRILLVLSLTANLLIVGLAAGAAWRHGGERGGRDFGFGPLTEAMSFTDRKALRDAFLEKHPDARAERRAMRADFEALIVALRAEPFDAAAVESAVATIARRNAELLETGRNLVVAHLAAMTAEERAAFADRLEKGLRRKGGRDRKEN
jgi:uncharacterized membrane protein